jgi:hypothetical protein
VVRRAGSARRATMPQNKGMKVTRLSAAPTLAPQAVLARRYLGVFSSHLGWPSANGQMVMSTGTCVTDTSS